MIRAKIAIAASSIILGIDPAASAQSQKDATELINMVGYTYRNLRSYHFEASAIIETKSETMQLRKETRFVIAVVKPDKIRMEVKGSMMGLDILVISNGSTTWDYMPVQKQYTRSEGTPTTVTSKGIDSQEITTDKDTYVRTWAAALGVEIPDYEKISEMVKRPRLVREEALEVDGSSIDCYVVEADNTLAESTKGIETSSKTFWIDRSRYVVLRESYTTRIRKEAFGDPAEIKHTTAFNVAEVNEPLPDATFVFAPPEGAKQVDDFNGPEKGGESRKRKKSPLH